MATATIRKPIRVQASRQFRQPPNTLRATRPSPFGNPFKGPHAVAAYRIYLVWALDSGDWDDFPRDLISDLEVEVAYHPQEHHPQWLQKNLQRVLQHDHVACFCGLEKMCHVDVLIDEAEKRFAG